MATLRSLYSSAIAANVPADNLAPQAPVFGVINAQQNTGVAQGRSLVTLNWAAPTLNETVSGETLIASATGASENFETAFDPLTTYTLYDDGVTISNASYSITTSTGYGTLSSGAVGAGSVVSAKYVTVLQDLNKFEVYRSKGAALISPSDRATVSGTATVTAVNAAIGSTYTSLLETLTAAENGQTWAYYIYAGDDETSTNYSSAETVVIETIPTIPQGLTKQVGDSQVIVDWNDVTDDNANGYNIYRVDGLTFTDASAKIVNASLLTLSNFDDSANNVTTRVSSGTLAYPVNGSSYSYKVESEDTTTSWTVGTNNTSFGVSASLIASLTAP